MPEPLEWVSATQAVALLQVSERSVRRFAGQLPEADRRKRQGQPAEFRLSSLCAVMGRADVPGTDRQAPEAPAPSLTGEDRRVPDTAGQVPDHELVAQLRAEVEDLRRDREHWRTHAEKSLQLADQAQRLQLAAEKRLAEVEGKLLPDAPGVPAGDSGGATGSGGGITPPDPGKPAPAGFWARLWRRG